MAIVTIGEVRTAGHARLTVRGRPGDGTDDVEVSTLPGLWVTRSADDLRTLARLDASAADWLDARAAARAEADQLALDIGQHL